MYAVQMKLLFSTNGFNSKVSIKKLSSLQLLFEKTKEGEASCSKLDMIPYLWFCGFYVVSYCFLSRFEFLFQVSLLCSKKINIFQHSETIRKQPIFSCNAIILINTIKSALDFSNNLIWFGVKQYFLFIMLKNTWCYTYKMVLNVYFFKKYIFTPPPLSLLGCSPLLFFLLLSVIPSPFPSSFFFISH